jgi:hypothetical protein
MCVYDDSMTSISLDIEGWLRPLLRKIRHYLVLKKCSRREECGDCKVSLLAT